MNSYDRMLYWLFKKTKGIKLGSVYSGVPSTNDKDLSPMHAAKANSQWEVASLYYTVPTQGDDLKHLVQ
jgi:hypothetical protein